MEEGKWELMGNDQASRWQARRLSVVFGWMVPLSKVVRTQGFSDLVHKSEGRKAKKCNTEKIQHFLLPKQSECCPRNKGVLKSKNSSKTSTRELKGRLITRSNSDSQRA